MERPNLLLPLPRPIEMATGLLITVVSGVLLLTALRGLLSQWHQASPQTDTLIILSAFLVAGVFCLFLGWRLFSGKASGEGGQLLSPAGWRTTGWAFIVFAVGFLVATQWLGVLVAGIFALWCFLATRLRRQSSPAP